MEGSGQLVRVVDLIVMRVASPSGLFLVETKQKLPDGRERDRNLLPGAMKRPDEDIMKTAKRIVENELNITLDSLTLRSCEDEVLDDEHESMSYPGLTSVYHKVFVE